VPRPTPPSCALPALLCPDLLRCAVLPATLSPPSPYILRRSDLLLLNPGLASYRTGTDLVLPCYPMDEHQRLAYQGSDVAYGLVRCRS